ncbi:hypothetical protein Trydic_g12056 [Trypoxylus dichotomus]
MAPILLVLPVSTHQNFILRNNNCCCRVTRRRCNIVGVVQWYPRWSTVSSTKQNEDDASTCYICGTTLRKDSRAMLGKF